MLTRGAPARWRISRAMVLTLALLAGQASSAAGGGSPLDLFGHELVDLTHPFESRTIYWPTAASGFELTQLAHGHTDAGYFYAANAFRAPEHGGTHLDAPEHFGEGKQTVDELPLDQLIAPAVVIDVSARAAQDHDYRLSAADVLAFEKMHGRIAPGTLVILRTGWSRRWPDRKAYLGDDTPGDASKLHFPAFGESAAKLLVTERRVAGLGVDSASLDHGPSKDFIVHQIAATGNVPGLENLTNLEKLPPTGAVIIALPMKIAGGSGAPVRAIAILPRAGAEAGKEVAR
ncbi:MAG: cyclase family protein [Deltaproteobacteria bacterium]|nr:cyclase family protein [Deltaproteobacteria bacterium]